MDSGLLLVAIIIILVVIFGSSFLLSRPRKLNSAYFSERWIELQKLCAKQDTWPLAIINADKLLDEALKRRHYKGKTMGERLVSAQKALSSNDSVWHAHKLRNRLVHEDLTNLSEQDVKSSLVGIRQALHDLGALK